MTKAIKVLHVIPSIGPARGGPSFVVRTLARSLVRAGLEVHVATTDDNGPDQRSTPATIPTHEDGATYWIFPRQTRFYQFSLPLTAWLWRNVATFDVVHIHALFSYSSVAAAWCAQRACVPYIVRPLGTLNTWGMRNRRRWIKMLSFPLIERRILRRASFVHYTSQQEAIEAHALNARETPLIVPNPVEPSLRKASGWLRTNYPQLAGRKIILFLSRLDRKKGIDLLLPAFANLQFKHPDASLVIVGDGDPEFIAELKRVAQVKGLSKELLWAGFLNGEAKLSAFADADIYVLPSYSENFGVSVVEAMGAGLPVVITDQVGIHREVSAANAGLVTDCSTGQLETAMSTLLQDPQLRKQMGQNGIDLARRFSPELVTAAITDAYATLCHRCVKPVAA